MNTDLCFRAVFAAVFAYAFSLLWFLRIACTVCSVCMEAYSRVRAGAKAKTYTTWSSLRGDIVDLVSKHADQCKEKRALRSDNLIDVLNVFVPSSQSTAMDSMDPSELPDELQRKLRDNDLMKKLRDFMEVHWRDGDIPTRLNKATMDIERELWHVCNILTDAKRNNTHPAWTKETREQLMATVLQLMDMHVRQDFINLGRLVADSCAQEHCVPCSATRTIHFPCVPRFGRAPPVRCLAFPLFLRSGCFPSRFLCFVVLLFSLQGTNQKVK